MEGPRQLEQLRWAREAKAEKERVRVAKEAEQRRQETRRREQEALYRQRLAAIEQEWSMFKEAAMPPYVSSRPRRQHSVASN